MIRYLRHTDIDRKKWDKLIGSSPQGIQYASSWYLDIVSPGWEALVENDYDSVFPLTHRKKAWINYLHQPFFTQQLGLFTPEQFVPEKKLIRFLESIPKKFKLVEIQLNSANNIPELNGYNIVNNHTHHLDLSNSIEKITSCYSENIKRNLKKSQKTGIRITPDFIAIDLVDLFRKNRGEEIRNLRGVDYETLITLLEAANKFNLLDFRGVMNSENKLMAGAVFLKSFHSYIFLFSAVSFEAKDTGAMSAIIDSFIRDHVHENKILDFEGSNDVNLARFYKSFGSQEVVYLQILKNNLPLLIRWIKQLPFYGP